MEYYHLDRTHQRLGSELIDGVLVGSAERLCRHARLGRVLNSDYHQLA